MTKNYFIIAAGPLLVVPIHLLFWKKPYIENHHWLPQEGGNIWVIEKSTGKVAARFESEPFFHFHHVNAWEEGEEIVMDLNAYNDSSIVQQYYLRELEKENLRLPAGKIVRYRLNLRTKKSTSAPLSDACIELPRIDYWRYNTCADYRYVYGISVHPDHPLGFYNSLVKIDTVTGKSQYWRQDGCYPGEPCFVPRPGSRHDEDGILLSIVLDTTHGNSYLLILDAASLEEIARTTVPEPVVFGFHAEFFPSMGSS